MHLIALFSVLVVISLHQSTTIATTLVKQCPGTKGSMVSVTVGDCQEPPCLLKKSTSVPVEIQFKPSVAVKQVKSSVTGRIGAMPPVGMPGLDGKAACDKVFTPEGDVASCPLAADTLYVYKGTMQILPSFPAVSPMLRWAVQDANSKLNVACFEIKCKIVN